MTERDSQVLLEIFRGEIRWYHFLTPEARNIVTDRVRTDAVRRLAEAGRVDIGEAEPGSYSVPTLIDDAEAVDAYLAAGNAALIKALDEVVDVEASLAEVKRRAAEGPGSTSPGPGPEPGYVIANVQTGPPRPPYGSPERAAYDAEHGPAPWLLGGVAPDVRP